MFELNGEQYSLQQVEEAAKQSSMSLDDYVSEYGLIKMEDEGKTNGVADEGATVTPTTGQAPEVTELESVDISSESQPKRSVRGETRKKELEDRSVEDQEEKTTDDSNWENYDFIDDVGKRLKISLKSIEQGMTRLPAFVNEIKFAISKPFLSEEDKNYFDNLSTEEQQEFVNKIGGAQQLASSAIGLAQMPVDAQESLEKSEETRKELEELESELVQFDNTIAQDIADGNIGRATVRTASQAIAAIPSVVQAFIPYVGIPSIVLGEASKASGEAQRKGENISLKTIGYSSIIGASEGLLEIFTKKIGKSVYKSLVDKPKEVVEKNIKDLVLNVSKSAGSEGLSESGTLTINKLADAVILKDEKAFDNYMLELADTFIVGSAVGGPLRGTGEAGSMLVNAAESRSVNKELKNSKYENLTQAFEDPNVDEATVNLSENKYTEKFLDFDLKKKVESGELTTEQAAEIKNNFLQTQGAANSLKPLNLSTTDKAQVIDLVKEKKSLENTIKQVDDTALTEPQNQRVKEINNLLRDFSTKAIVQETAKVKSVLGGLKSVGVKEPMSTKEIENYLLKNNIAKDKSDAIKKSGQGALIFQDPDTKEQTIIVNKDIGNVADASHEGLHALIYETVRKSPDTAIRLGESLQQELNKIDPNLIEDLGIRERLELYNEDPSAVRAEEVLTLFSDTVRTGAFKFNENVFTKIGDVIRQFLSSIGVKAKFNNGRDVYNFIKDYQRSIEKGKLTRGQERAATEGATGRLVGPKIETFVETTTAKESRSEEASQRVQEIYDQQGTAGAFEIIEQFKPITSKLVERRSEAPGFDRQLLTDEIETGQRGIIDLISEYDPDSGVPLAAYINKFLPARAIEASNRVLSEEFTEDVTEARGVVAEEADVEVVEQPKGPKKPTETTRFSDTVLNNLGVKNKAEAEKQISDATNKAFKGQDVTRFGQTKNIPVAVAEIYGKMFGVNPETIYDKKRNYSKKDSEGLTRIKQYLIDNATSDFARLPKTKDDFGKATFIPNNVMNALYTDGELTGTLKDYLDLIREKPVKPIYRDRVGQTIRGLFNTSIRNRMVEDLIPSKPERARAGVKFAKVTKPKVRQNRFEVSGKNGIVIMRDNAEQFAKANNVTIEFEGETITAKNLDSKNPKHRAYVQQQIENELWKYFPLEAIDASTVVGYRDGFYFTKEEWAKTSERAKTNKAEWLARGNKLNYNLEAVKAAKAVKTPPKNKEYYSSDKFKNKLKNWKAGVKAILDGGADAIKADPNMYLPVYAIFSTQSQSSSHLVRNMSVERGASEAFINATKSTPTVKEHVEPSNEMAPLMYEAMLFDEVDVLMPVVDLIYYQLGITKTQDDKTLDVSGMYGDPYNYKTTQTDEFNEALREYFKTGDVDKILSPLIRYFNPQVNNNTSEDNIPGFNSNALIFEGKTVAEVYTKQLTKSEQNNDNLFYQNELTYQVLKGDITQQQAVERLNEFTKIKTLVKASKSNDGKLPPGIRLEDPKTFDKFDMANTVARRMFPKQANSDAVKSGRLTAYEALDPDQKFIVMQEVPGSPIVKQTIDLMATSDEAIKFSRNADAPDKGISVWDFDDTLATTKSNVLYTMPNGTEGTLTAEQFAKQGEQLLEEGAEFDFSEFEKVTKGAKGPMFEKAVARNRKFGNDNVFILTARTQAAAEPIHQFLKAIGLDIPLKNIVGLGNSTPEAKARWVVGKAAEGYNDFYFADDAYKNVKAVQDALNVLDVKSKVRQAYIKHSKSEALDKGFNDILEQTSGIASEKEYKKVKAEVAGASLGRVFRGIPYSAQDLVGLLYETLGKGKLGDSQMAWYKKHLLDPYARAVNDIDNARLSVMQDYRALKKQLGFVPKNLRKKLPGEPFTREQAVRVYIWNKLGYDVPGISNQDLKELSEYVADNADLQVFADQVIDIQKGEYAKPKEGWPAGTITTDIQESINTGVRAKYLTQWQNNVDVIFSEKNMNKLEAAYGKKYRKAMENMLGRMKTGRNRNFSDDSLTARFTDWLQGSIGAIMFFNSRSALLQNLSSINFLNFTDNNPLAAARAFSNQKQYWSDFSKLINSDFLKARRSGLRMNVNEADIADMAKKGGPRAVISKLLQFGFTPTQIADSFAIASGGATFYRNRIKTYTKQGLSQQEAEAKAFEDFRETAEESQQSARPDRISMQQAGPLGRLILAFQNTPSQYARIIDKSVRDLKNRRGDAKTNVSKIIYYATVQNLIFNALQQALFAFAFDDEEPEDEEKKEKYVNILNSMSDSLLRGTGVAGGVMSVTKNAIIRIVRESQKDNPNYEKVGADLQRIAPPVSSKLSKINQAARSFKWDKDEMINGGWGLDNPAYLAVGNVVSATTNIPMDRGVKKINNLMKASDSELETWERLALLGGWQDWEIGIDDEEKKKKPQDKQNKKESKLIKSKIRKSKTK
ncbi:MAG: hypothetical protein ACYSO0_01135 [Planctomycetota bacterium]|jgi:Fe-S cluster biosynthesis and repair protein YggX